MSLSIPVLNIPASILLESGSPKVIYGTVVVPEVVAQELETAKSVRLQTVLSLDWIVVRSPTELAITEAQQ